MQFFRKGKKGQNTWKFGQKCTKFDNILKKGSLMRVAIIHMKQLEYALHTKLHADDVIDDCNTQLKLLSTIAES